MARRGLTTDNPSRVPRVALLDANVFFSPRMRDLVMQLREFEVVQIHWTKKIEMEWTRNVIEKHDADPQAIEACLAGMREATQGDWEVAGYDKYVHQFDRVDVNDRHVAAAAYKLSLDNWPGQRVALVTKNVKDFPQQAFEATRVTRYSLALYLELLSAEEPALVGAAIHSCGTKLRMRKPKCSKADYVALLVRNGCQSLAEVMAAHWKVECPSISTDGSLTYATAAVKRSAIKRARLAKNPLRSPASRGSARDRNRGG